MKIWGGRELMLGGEGGGGNPRAPLPLYETLMCTSTLWVLYLLPVVSATCWLVSAGLHAGPKLFYGRHHCWDMYIYICVWMDCPILSPCHNHLWQRMSVRIFLVGTADTSPWYPAYSHHSISPNHEWHGGKTSSSTKSCSQNISCSWTLDKATSNCVIRNLYST